MTALEEVMCTTKAMTTLGLAHCHLTDHCASVLGRLVEFVPKLALLDVSWNQLGPLAAEALAGGLVPGEFDMASHLTCVLVTKQTVKGERIWRIVPMRARIENAFSFAF